jgi:hypothetical protein
MNADNEPPIPTDVIELKNFERMESKIEQLSYDYKI